MGGKTGKWLSLFLKGKREKERSATNQPSVDLSATPLASQSTPPTREKKRWSFRRSPDSTNSTNPPPRQRLPTIVNSNEEQKNHAKDMAAAAAEAAVSAARASAAVLRQTHAKQRRNTSTEEAAAIKIQSIFRSYLARKALRALRGLVKLQALVRGHLTRKRAAATLRCIQSLVNAQCRARAYRTRNYFHISSKEMEESIKIVEMDCGSKSRKSYASQSSSAITEMGLREYSGQHEHEHEDYSFNTAQSSSYCDSAISMPDNPRVPFSLSHDYPPYPNYMANTESSRAKVRSHSAPKQRPDSFEKQMSRRRASVELKKPLRINKASNGQDLLDLFAIKFFSSTASIMGSECGSSSTVLTNANYYDMSRFGFK